MREAKLSDLMTIAEVLDRLRCSRSSLYVWMDSQQFPRPLKFGTANRWLRGEVDAWVERQAAGRVKS